MEETTGSLLMLHPNPAGGGMMDSHLYKKAANRLPAMAGIQIIRFNTRGSKSQAGQSEGTYGHGKSEKLDVIAALDFCFEQLKLNELFVVGWSFGTELALQYARDKRIRELILLSPPMLSTTDEDLDFWIKDGRRITALIPELDDYLKPEAAKIKFAKVKNLKQIDVNGAKHLWVGEPMVHLVLSEIVRIIAPDKLPLATEI
jgi:alpha/beta superfamily hydrolase